MKKSVDTSPTIIILLQKTVLKMQLSPQFSILSAPVLELTIKYYEKKLPFALGLLLPIILVIFVALLSFLPKHLIRPQYNFLYATGDYFYSPVQYIVKDNHVLMQVRSGQIKSHNNAFSAPEQIYYYDVKQNKAIPITLNQAQKYTLDPHIVSPDGFRIVYGSSETAFFPLFLYTGNDRSIRFLAKQSYRLRLNLKLIGQFYDNFYFLGWITNGKA